MYTSDFFSLSQLGIEIKTHSGFQSPYMYIPLGPHLVPLSLLLATITHTRNVGLLSVSKFTGSF